MCAGTDSPSKASGIALKSRAKRRFGALFKSTLSLLAFDVLFAPAAVEATAPLVSRDCPDCPELVSLAPDPSSGIKPFAIGRYEVTWHQYLQAINGAGCSIPRGYDRQPYRRRDLKNFDDDIAVSGVSVVDVECYLAWLGSKTGKAYRLPSGAEWEYAARGGTTTRYPWGNELGNDHSLTAPYIQQKDHLYGRNPKDARFGTGIGKIGMFSPNAYGLFDVIGNVTEWTSDIEERIPWDWCVKKYERCKFNFTRGGSVKLDSQYDLSSSYSVLEIAPHAHMGFRIAR